VGFAGAMALALVLDALLGWRSGLVALIGHPVTWMGRAIDTLDARWNRIADPPWLRRMAGVAAALIVITLASGFGWAVQRMFASPWSRVVVIGILEHVAAVARPLGLGDLTAARSAVAKIVGRDPDRLDEVAIARATIESLAENTSDGIVAPLFWGALFGLPGIIGYKAINTLDSMIGHRTERHEAFGWAAARIDDVANFVPARLTGLLFAAIGGRPREALACMTSDARKHRSINAGWPEAAMAGALGVRLCGPRFYNGELAAEPWLNQGARDPGAIDIMQGLKLYIRAMACFGGLLAVLAFI